MTIQFDEEKQKKQLGDLRILEEEELAQSLASQYGLQYINLATISVNADALRTVPEAEARAAKIAPFDRIGKKLLVGLLTPRPTETVDALKKLEDAGFTLQKYMISMRSLEKAWSLYKEISFATESQSGGFDISKEGIEAVLASVQNLKGVGEHITEVLNGKATNRVSKILEVMIGGAFALDASDIHLEPEEEYARLRYRLDGVLNDVLSFDRATYALILSRVKLISGMKLNIRATSQDGRFSVKIKDSDIEIRTSILPGAYSESIVLRILNPKTIAVPLEELGIHPSLLKVILEQIAKPNGMVLTTGPTGSGKTTTLYAFLKKVHTAGVKIITIEDPIEYHLPGIVQTQVNPEKKYTFLEGLRSALRQDPDVIMVGEIRDEETAEIAINSSLTGHLVFSTLHTNTAAGAFPRLIDLKVNPKVITSAINMAMAQRLIRKLCATCKKKVPLEGEAKKLVARIVAAIGDREKLPNTTEMWIAVGCDKCNNTGYKGRTGIYEAILTDEKVEQATRENPSEREIKAAALPQGIFDMAEDGIIKLLAGITSLDELNRIIDLTL